MSKISVLAVGDPAVEAYKDKELKILEQFEDTVNFDIISWDKYSDYLKEVFEGKREYDIVMVAGHLWLRDFASKGYLSEVKPYDDASYDFDDILKVIRDEISIEDKVYLYPSFCDGHILLYRKSIIKELLCKELNEVIDTDEIIELAKICDGYKGMKGIALKGHKSEVFLDFLPYFRNEKMEAFVLDNMDSNVKNTIEGKVALEKYKSLYKYAPIDSNTYGNDEVKEAFQTKKVAIAVTWGGQLGSVLNDKCEDIDDVGFCALSTSFNVTWSFAITKNSNKKKEAEEFLKAITNSKVDRIIGGYAGSPVRKSTYILDRDKHKWYDIHLKLIDDYAKPLPSMLNCTEKLGSLYDYVYEYVNSEK